MHFMRWCYLYIICGISFIHYEAAGETINTYGETISLIKAYFEFRHISLVTAFVCWGTDDYRLVRSLSSSGIRVNLITVPRDFVYILEQEIYYRVGVLVDMACHNSKQVLTKASLKKQFNILKFWFILENGRLFDEYDIPTYDRTNYCVIYSKDNNLFPAVNTKNDAFDTVTNYSLSEFGISMLSNMRILSDSEVVWAQKAHTTRTSDETQVEMDGAEITTKEVLLLDVYKTSIIQPLNVSITGLAFLTDNIEENRLTVHFVKRAHITQRRTDLHGAHFKTATVILYPEEFTDWYDLRLRHIDKWSKVHWPIYGYLTNQMNFSFEVTYQLDNYGWLINGTFDGMMGYMQREEVEFPSTGIFVRKDRFAVTSYAADTFPLRATTIFRQPSLSTVSNIFILPFDTQVWLCCVALYFTTIALLGLQVAWTVKQMIEQDMIYATWSDIFTLVLGAICQQGYHTTPTSLGGRITVFILTLSSLFLFTSYSANIVALLQTPSTSFRTISDLTHSPMVIEVENQTYNRVYMQETTDPELREFYLRKIAPLGEKAYHHASIGMAEIKQTMHAFQVDTTSAYKIMSETYEEHEKCGLKEIDLFPSPMFTIATTKGSSLREHFSQRVRWYREIGLLDRLFKIWMPQKAKCESNAGRFVSVSLVEFYPAMIVLQYGTGLAFFILALEVFYFHRSYIIFKFASGFKPWQKNDLFTKRKHGPRDCEINNKKKLFRVEDTWIHWDN